MLYNKNQFRKTNDKKVLHKIGKHWVTVSVAFLSLLGLGAVSTTATTHADTTDNANAQTTSAAPNSNSADSIQKQVTKQANALHNQLLGHAAVSQKPAQQGTARLGSVNGRVNQAQTQNAQQNKKPANNQMSANHSNVMRLGSRKSNTQSLDVTYGTVNGLNYTAYSDPMTPQNTKNVWESHFEQDQNVSDYFDPNKPNNINDAQTDSKDPSYETLRNPTKRILMRKPDLPMSNQQYYNSVITNHYKPFKSKSGHKKYKYNDRKYASTLLNYYAHHNVWINHPYRKQVPLHHNYHIEFTSGNSSDMTYLLDNITKQLGNVSDIVSIKFDKGVNTNGHLKSMQYAFGGSDGNNAHLQNITGMSDFNTSNVSDMYGAFQSDTKLSSDVADELGQWKFKENPDAPVNTMILAPNTPDAFKYSDMRADSDMRVNAGSFNNDVRLTPVQVTTNGQNYWHYNVKHTVINGQYDGFDFTYNSNTGDLEFTKGTLQISTEPYQDPTSAPKNTFSEGLKTKGIDPAQVTNIKFDKSTSFGTSYPVSLKGMFYNMSKLLSVNMEAVKADPSNITDMSWMFTYDKNLENITFPKNMDLSHVADMSYMFDLDQNLSDVDFETTAPNKGFSNIGQFAPKGVSMAGMFRDTMYSQNGANSYNGLNEVFQNGGKPGKSNGTDVFSDGNSDINDVPDANVFDTSHVVNMDGMFQDAGFPNIQLPLSFKTNNVKSMRGMFNSGFITYLNFGKYFDTSNVTDMSNMFADSGITKNNSDESGDAFTLPSNFNTRNVTNMSDMFANVADVQKIVLPENSFNTSKVSDMSGMFANDNNLNYLHLPEAFDTSNVTNMSNMFARTNNVTSSDIAQWQDASNKYNKFDLKLSKNFYIDGETPSGKVRNTKGVFLNTPITVLTLEPSGKIDTNTKDPLTNTVFNSDNAGMNYTNANTNFDLKLYREKSPKGQFGTASDGSRYTLTTPNQFNKGVAGTYTREINVPKEMAYSDIFSDIDGHLDWRLNKTPRPIKTSNKLPVVTNSEGDWVFMTSDGEPTFDYTRIGTRNGRALVAPLYHGLVTKFDAKNHTAEFIDGHISDTSLRGFDDPNISPGYRDPQNGFYTIEYAITHKAHSLIFDGYQADPSTPQTTVTIISDVPDMSYMFANPNLQKITFDGIFNTSNTTNMKGMFQGAQISDLSLPSPVSDSRTTDNHPTGGFYTNNVSDSDEANMFDLPKLTELDVNTPTTFASDSVTKLPTMYKIVSKKNSPKLLTEGTPYDFTSLDDQGRYITSKDAQPVTDNINFVYTDKSGRKNTVDTIQVKQDAGTYYDLGTSDTGIDYPSFAAIPKLHGYQFANNRHSDNIRLGDSNQDYTVKVEPIVNSTYVKFVYGKSDTIYRNLSADGDDVNSDFKGTMLSDTKLTNAYKNMPKGWQLDPSYHGSVEIPHIRNVNEHGFNGDTHPIHVQVVPIPATVHIEYVEPSDGNKVVGHYEFQGNNYYSGIGNYENNITANNMPGLSSDYNLVNPDNHFQYNNRTIPIPVDKKYSIDYMYDNAIVGNSSLASSFTGTEAQNMASINSGIPGGYHLASGASTTMKGKTYDVSVTPNTVTENISYAVQNDPQQYSTANSLFSGFSSVINDDRTSQFSNNSFEINEHTQVNTIPNGYHLVSDYKVGPVTTNLANSSATHYVQIVPDQESIHIYFKDQHGTQVGEYSDKGFAGNSLNKPIVRPAHYTLPQINQILSGKNYNDWATIKGLPTKFTPGYGDETIRVIEIPATATDTVNYVDETNDNKTVGQTHISGTDITKLPKASDTTANITSSFEPGIPNGYVLANNSTPVKYDGGTYNVLVVPNNNVFTVNYQYDGQTIGTQAYSGKKPTDELDINNGNEKGLPAGYSLIDQHNAYGNKFIYADKSGNVAIQPNQVSDTINFMNGNQKVGSTTVSGNDYRATAAGNNQAEIDNNTPGLPSRYYVLNNPIAVNYDGNTHDINVAPDEDIDTVDYQYNNNTIGSDQFDVAQGSHIDITNNNQPNMPVGYHLVNNDNSFIANNGNHNIQITPDMMTFTITFTSKGKPVATKTYQGATDSKFKVNSATDTPNGYTINGNQNVNFKFDGDKANDNASLAVTPIPPKYATETINFLYTNDAAGKVFSEGATKKSNLKGSQGTIMSSDYTNINPGYQVVPGENKFNKGSVYTFDNGSVDIYVEPIQQTDTIWYVNDQTGKLIANDGPFTDTISKTGNDSRASDANNTSFVIGAKPSDLRTDYYAVDNPGQSIPFDGQKHVVSVHLIKQAPYSAQASQAAKTKAAQAAQAATAASISAQASKIAKEQNSKAASSYASSATSNAASSMATSTTNSVTSTNDNSEYNHEQSSNSSAQSSEASSASASVSSANSSSNSSIASQSTSFSSASVAPRSSALPKSSSASSVAPSSSAASIVPFIPITPSSVPSSVSSVASSIASPSVQSVSSSAAPVNMTNKNYPITYAKNVNKPDVVTVMGRKYPVHYHANGKNTVRVRERIMKHGKASYRYKNVVVSTNLPIAKVSSDNLVRAVDHVDFNKVNKRAWSAKGLNKALSNAKPGEVISYHGTRLAVVNDPIHWRYFMVNRNTLAHILVTGVGRDDTRNILNARHEYTIFIRHIVAVHGRKANYVRYEFSYHHHNFWVTARDDFVPNSYWQKSDFRARHAHYVRVVRPCRLYKSTKYNRLTYIRNVRRGVVAHVAKVVYINRPSYEQTRLVLTNGHYITANKNFVHIIK